MHTTTGNRLWVRDHFMDHPKYTQKSLDSCVRDKAKVFCKLCLSYRINQCSLEDQEKVKNGTRQEVRTEEMIVLEGAFLWLCSHCVNPDTFLQYLLLLRVTLVESGW